MKGKRTGLFTAFLIITAIFVCARAWAVEDPDELYRAGRFAEARKIYTDRDMDHPRDLRYRYNRGCAGYEEGKYKEAMAAFSSVLRRAKEPEMRLRAAYNLGNTAFKQGDFASASEYYKKALQIDPESRDAAYNLEIALRELEKQKKEQKEKEAGKNSGKGKDRKDRSQGKKDGKGSEKPSSEKRSGQKDSQDRDRQDKGAQGAKGRKEQSPPEDLSGELQARDQLPRPEKGKGDGESGRSASIMDRKKAEALLDNVKEDRSKYLEFQTPAGRPRGVLSGKDW